MKNIDIIITDEYDIKTDATAHDIVIGDVTLQNQALILVSQKGEWKEKPMVGCGLDSITNDEDISSWKRLIREELARDGIKINKLIINTETIEIDAAYENY